jgi:hypothetical protein
MIRPSPSCDWEITLTVIPRSLVYQNRLHVENVLARVKRKLFAVVDDDSVGVVRLERVLIVEPLLLPPKKLNLKSSRCNTK